jgi:hypothetical protein
MLTWLWNIIIIKGKNVDHAGFIAVTNGHKIGKQVNGHV